MNGAYPYGSEINMSNRTRAITKQHCGYFLAIMFVIICLIFGLASFRGFIISLIVDQTAESYIFLLLTLYFGFNVYFLTKMLNIPTFMAGKPDLKVRERKLSLMV